MTNHSVVEAENQLSSLIDRALDGETVVITRHGAAGALTLETARKRDAGENVTLEAAAARYYASEMVGHAADRLEARRVGRAP